MTVEVFKTNVSKRKYAKVLLSGIHKTFSDYRANFDLDDCDRILRVQCNNGTVCCETLISFLRDHGFYAEPLPD
ncbi:MAG TPA: hypothetical protein VIM77_04845 [Mucilaginibacter sp.]